MTRKTKKPYFDPWLEKTSKFRQIRLLENASASQNIESKFDRHNLDRHFNSCPQAKRKGGEKETMESPASNLLSILQ